MLTRLGGAALRLALVVVFGLLLAELVVSWMAPQALLVIEPGLYEADPPGRYRLSPGYRGSMSNRVEFEHDVTVDERALRASGMSHGPGTLMTLGDSFAFGMGVEGEEAFGALLAARRSATGMNGGLPGTGVPDLVGWYSRHGRALAPDLVVLAIFVGNDLADARPDRPDIRIVDGLVAPADTPAGLRSLLFRHSDLVRLVKNAAGSPALAGLRETLGLSEPWVIRNLRHEFSIYAIDPSPELVAAERATDEAFAHLVAMCSEDGTRLVAALIPARIQLVPASWEASLRMIGLDPDGHDPDHPRAVFTTLLDHHGVPYLDLGPPFAEAVARGEQLYYLEDRHWNAAGHALAAERIDVFLDGLI